MNPNVWKALLSLARQRKFRGPTVPCFVLEGSEKDSLKLMAREGEHAPDEEQDDPDEKKAE